MRKKKVWTHKKYGKQEFWGRYVISGGQRYLLLTGQKTGKRFEAESHEAAKKLGWVAK